MNRIDRAFSAFPRRHFLTTEQVAKAMIDTPMPIGYGQTNSQPTTVRRMLEWLDVQPANKVLDVGSGSGWTTALLSHLVGNNGKVFAVEVIAELVEFGRQNCEKAGVQNAEFFKVSSKVGLPEHSPYDRILVSAAAKRLPEELLEQLSPEGRLVIPIQNSIHVVEKSANGELSTEEHEGYAFVPLVDK